MAERLGDEGAGHRRALLHDAAERLGHAEDRQADLLGGGEHLGGCGAGLVGRGGGRAQHLGGELVHDVDEHLLVLGRRQVEDAARRRVGGPGARRCARPARANVRPAAVADAEAVAGRGVDGLLGLLAQADAVDEVALREPVDGGDGEPDGVAASRGTTTRGDRPAGGCCSEGHGSNVTLSYTLDQRPPRGAGHPRRAH